MVVVEEIGLRTCESGVVGQRVRLLIRRSAKGILLQTDPHGRYSKKKIIHSCSDCVINQRHRVQCLSVTARRRDRITCKQACHRSEVALRVHFTCCVFLSIKLKIQCPALESPNLLDLSRGRQLTALPLVPTSFPIARSMSSLSDAIPCLQSSCRIRRLIGE